MGEALRTTFRRYPATIRILIAFGDFAPCDSAPGRTRRRKNGRTRLVWCRCDLIMPFVGEEA